MLNKGFSQSTFKEMDDPNPVNPEIWNKQPAGLNVSFATIDKRFAKSAPPEITIQQTQTVKGWKGERISAQILVWSKQDLKNLKVSISDFGNKQGKLSKSIAKASFVRYVMTDVFGDGCGKRKPGDYPASLSPDMLDNLKSFDVEKNTLRPVWLSIAIPESVKAGVYQTKITVHADGIKSESLNLKLQVLNHVLPKSATWTYHLDLWQHPSAVARVNNLKMWSDEHFAAIKPVMKRLADAGQKVITTTLNKDPWNVQTYDPYADMIIWTKNEDNTWQYDYTVFDKYVQLMMDLGINKMINCYSIIPWNNQIHYRDAKTAQFIDVEAKPGTDVFKIFWTPFLKDFAQHLKQKGWLKITNIAMDERSRAQMDAAFTLMNEVAPELGIAYADNQKTYKRYPSSNDISIAIQHPYEKNDIVERTKKGFSSTFYICCSDSFPNTLTFSEPAEATYLGWYALASGFDGMLRWSYNSWVEKPLEDSRFRTWPAGDTYIVYPQNRTSIRFERLLEGVQDYEKARIIRQQFIKNKQLDKLKTFDEAIAKLNEFRRTPDWNKNLNKAKELLNSY